MVDRPWLVDIKGCTTKRLPTRGAAVQYARGAAGYGWTAIVTHRDSTFGPIEYRPGVER